MSKTIEELQKEEDENKAKIEQRKEWLKEKDYFILLDVKKFYGEPGGKVVFRLSDLKNEVESYNDFKYKGECEIVYRTNAWSEKLQELDL